MFTIAIQSLLFIDFFFFTLLKSEKGFFCKRDNSEFWNDLSSTKNLDESY